MIVNISLKVLTFPLKGCTSSPRASLGHSCWVNLSLSPCHYPTFQPQVLVWEGVSVHEQTKPYKAHLRDVLNRLVGNYKAKVGGLEEPSWPEPPGSWGAGDALQVVRASLCGALGLE